MYMLRVIIIFLFLLTYNLPAFSSNNEYFLMLKNNKVNVRYGPSLKSPVKFVYNKVLLPVKIIDKKDTFRRIIDHKKNVGWIHISQLRSSKSLVLLDNKIMFSKNSKFSNPLVKLSEGRLVIIKKCEENWCKVKTGSFQGWIMTDNVWGIN